MIVELYTAPEGEEVHYGDLQEIKAFLQSLGYTLDFTSVESTWSHDGRDHYEEMLISKGGRHTAEPYVKRRDVLKAKASQVEVETPQSEFDLEAKHWYDTAEFYADFGASDTEPRSVFAQIIIDLAEGRECSTPCPWCATGHAPGR